MKTNLVGVLLLIALITSCQTEPSISPTTTTGPEPVPFRMTRDSVLTGTYLGIPIGEGAEPVYTTIQSLQQTKGVTYLNVVSNIFSDLAKLKDRIPLYQYIILDQQQGTDSGVQITIENKAVKSIYLNSGVKLTQWPVLLMANAAVRVGDPIGTLYDKLAVIKGMTTYSNKFERISLQTKNLSTMYDQGMSQSPQWYFMYKTGPDQQDEVQVHFTQGKVSKIAINHYTPY
ncbi:hypothetical protein EXU85_16335 [Spirosoma sp. KCTC 42546]|uniref:hypothetical protein n=1 Tax=Spirosoma sp. KCTC 42546 TaxID=2520506 RepID=UPI00115BF8CB|nr:hypothetical protein [Spirosoma sp. KCTC 42546]QDK80089.1 hypothetical protein EXU85_16335 [Spirosoma sp. KCTC 42546]